MKIKSVLKVSALIAVAGDRWAIRMQSTSEEGPRTLLRRVQMGAIGVVLMPLPNGCLISSLRPMHNFIMC